MAKKSEQWLPIGGWRKGINGKGHNGNGHILYLDSSWSYIHICICQDSTNIHLRLVHFILGKFTSKLNKYFTLVNDTHVEVFKGNCTDVCALKYVKRKVDELMDK